MMILKYIHLIILFIPIVINAQFVYNVTDTSYVFKFKEMSFIRDTIQSLNRYKIKTDNYEKQISSLFDIIDVQDKKISKLELRDSLYNKEISVLENIHNIQNEKLETSFEILKNYQKIIDIKNNEIILKDKEIIYQKKWKNIYKHICPIAILSFGLLLLK